MTDRLEELRSASDLLNIPDEQHVFGLMEWAVEEIERLRKVHVRFDDVRSWLCGSPFLSAVSEAKTDTLIGAMCEIANQINYRNDRGILIDDDDGPDDGDT